MKRPLFISVLAVCILGIGGWIYADTESSKVAEGVRQSPVPSPAFSPAASGSASADAGRTANRCSGTSELYDSQDARFCYDVPKLNRFRLFEINLTGNRILFYEQGMLSRTFPIAYQAAYGKWFETPTGYFQVGVKKQKFMSSIVPVYMENAVQLYEDFFVHGIPYYADGTRVTSQFSGGCIRLEDPVAKDFYGIAQKGDDVVSYATMDGYAPKEGFSSPVRIAGYWVRQRFNSPLKVDFSWHEDNRENYIQHTGMDFAPLPGERDTGVYAIRDGAVEKIVRNGEHDRGLGNTVILSHIVDGKTVYSLYGHLSYISNSLQPGSPVIRGEQIGIVGNTGYGCNYWKVGKDGCDNAEEADTHLHLEIKDIGDLGSPIQDPACAISKEIRSCVGYTSDDPRNFGYLDPLTFIFDAHD